jgi:hypothetical protein
MIPKTLHYMWFGGKQMPQICKECIESWHKVLPADWLFQFWNEDNYMAMNFAPVALATCPYMRSGATSSKSCVRIAVWNLSNLQIFQNEHVTERY